MSQATRPGKAGRDIVSGVRYLVLLAGEARRGWETGGEIGRAELVARVSSIVRSVECSA